MENQFICPHCGGHLKVGDRIIFRVRNAKKKYGLLLLSPQIGNYNSVKHPQFEYSEGEALDFYCPICSHILSTTIDENLIFVVMVDNHGVEHNIYFSRIMGEQSTYQVSGDTVTATGEHSGKYTYFSMSDRFRQFLKK
jgi:transcription elongation factor Elf1